MARWIGPLFAAFLLSACASAISGPAVFVPPRGSAVFGGPSLEHLLVVTDHAGLPLYEHVLAEGAAITLHHFARETSWKYVDDLTAADVKGADAVVYLPTRSAMPAKGWQNLRYARRLVVFNQHLAQMQTLGFFPHVSGAREIRAPAHSEIHYDGQTFALPVQVYTRFDVDKGARVLGSVTASGTTPFAVIDGRAAFVAAPLSFDSGILDPYAQGYLLADCDVLRIALGAPAEPRVAMLRFEDVSIEVPSDRMWAIVKFMALRRLPYGIGVIPNQWVKGTTIRPLSSDPDLVAALRFGQANGARIILHGFHHSYDSPEDFEFWDHVHNRPLSYDSVPWMTGRIEKGLAIERGLGLWPVMWESPHYAASPLDYRVVGKFFAMSWERRDPVDFMPWPIQDDEYGSVLLPEDLGYVALQGQGPEDVIKWETLDMQLARAKDFLVCKDCVPAGFLHPSTVSIDTVAGYVDGLQKLGYHFVDPLRLIALPPGKSIPFPHSGTHEVARR